ncbi:hypothetical protein BJ138DRAFT_1175554 [Hygrophoropsis aurantiaca]|uniref:Uncharacterized protein n=1 Tax=Hygrophoropsis aurantiaca TaxID=72124 RepID=A0ACB8AUH3_9AGAM|nr:hypothetical protein BJ138DRAFT_1175554 [Hygrophoropsis aurantiaca]
MAISNPTQLIGEFKKSGEFDRLRRELLTQFQNGDRIVAFKSRIEDIARQRLASDQKLQHMPHDAVHRELMGEMDRYPIVERAVNDAPSLSDPSFTAAIRSSIQRILDEDKKSSLKSPKKDDDTKGPNLNPNSAPVDPSSSNGQQTSI